VKDHFPDGQLFVNLRGHDPGEPVTAEQALRHFLRALGVAATDVPQEVDAAAALYRSLLADRRVLILLDNAATAGQVRPLLPGSGTSLVVVTSRNRLAALAVRDGARRLTLGMLPEPEAVALLRAITSGYRPEDDPGRLAELARLCARLPLALRIAAERAAAHPHLFLDDLIADLRDESALWDTLSTGSDEEAEAVRTVFAWSYRALSAPAAQLFRLLGLHPAPEFGPHAAAALAELTLGRARQLLDDLVGAHLLEQTAPDRYQFHDLLRAYATDQAHTEESPVRREASLKRVLDWYLHTADSAQTWISPGEARLSLAAAASSVPPLVFTDFNAAVDWSEREHPTFPHLVRAAAAAGLDAYTWRTAIAQWNVLPPSASYADWPAVGLAGLEAAERSDEQAARITLLTLLGVSCRQLNRLTESLDHHRRALSLASACAARFDEARRAIDEALDIALTLRDHTLEGYWLLTLGDIQRTAGAYGEALISYQRSAMLHRRLGDRSREALAWGGTGQTYAALGRPGEAAAFHRQAAAVHGDLGDAWQRAVELDHLAAAVRPRNPQSARTHWTEALARLAPYPDSRTAAVRTRIQRQLTELD
jgi:tetratricopeptide (TPR) repeat protein